MARPGCICERRTIRCIGCGLTVSVRRCRLIEADYYTCGRHSCVVVHPVVADAVHDRVPQAAADYTGHRYRVIGDADREVHARLAAILASVD